MFSLRPPSTLCFSGNAAFALQDPLQGGVEAAAETWAAPRHLGRGAYLGNSAGEQVFSFVNESSLHPLTTTTNYTAKMTIPISHFVRSDIGYSPPDSRFRLSSRTLSLSPE